MAGSLREIQAKIASTKKTSQITGAMQMVSASKLTRSEQAAKDFQIYASKIRQITTDLLHSELINGSSNPMLDAILKAVLDMIKRDHDSEDEYAIISIGGTGSDFFKARNMNVAFELRGLEDQPSFEQVGKIISKAVGMYQNELFDELYVCYNHHVNSLSSEVRVEQMLPIADLDPNESEGHVLTKFELEPDRDTILDQLLPQYAESLIYGAIVDAKTAEHAAGMTAMQTATDNAKNVINDLTIQYNRARQAAITQEITEIVGGASALE